MLWLVASAFVAGILILTIAWFAPNNARFSAKSIPLEQVSARLELWLLIHYLRIGLAVMA